MHQFTTNAFPRLVHAARQIAVCWIALSVAGVIVPVHIAQARDSYVPYIESLDISQKRAYFQAAPSGHDEVLSEPHEALTTAIPVLVEEESRLEQLAEAQRGPLTLEETQQNQILPSDLEQFGYDIFKPITSAVAPVAGIPVPVNYRIGPSDNIIVQLYGKRNVEYKLVVTREGNILVPEYGPVKVAGLTFDEADKLISEGFESRVIGAKVVVTLGQLRSIQIRLAGDVQQPGIYVVGGLSTLIDALLTTGGVRRSGSLRKIELIRGGKRISRLDLYDLLQRGHSDEDIYLAHNDTIFVPPIGDIIYVGGEVQRPAIYELNNEKNVGQIIDMAGGLLPTASLGHSLIERIQTEGTRTLIDFSDKRAHDNRQAILQTPIRTGDFLRILPVEKELRDVVLLSGHVKRPGGYQFRSGMRVSDIVPGVDTLLPGADVDFLLIKREQVGTLRTEIVYVDLIEAFMNPASVQDIVLQARDQLLVFNLAANREQAVADVVKELSTQGTDYRPARVIEVRGAIRYNGRLPLQENARLLDVISMAGGLKPGAELYYGVIARTRHPSREIEAISFSVAGAMAEPASPANLEIMPGDRLYYFDEERERSPLLAPELERLRQQANFGADERLVSIMGEVLHPGIYPLTGGMRASDLLCAARGLTRRAYSLGAVLSRVQHNPEMDNAVQHISLDSVALLKLCDLARQLASRNISEAQETELGERYIDDQLNPVLASMDQLAFTEKAGWVERATVTLYGEVQHPGIYVIDRGETLCQVMRRAGGLTEDAYSFGAEFSRRSVREMQQKTLDEVHDQLDDLMVELSLSHSFNNEEKTSEEWAGKQDYMRTIRQLERAKATGRMVIGLERIMKCRDRDDLVLEDGDTLTVPYTPNFVQVSGQVYVPTSHLYRDDRKISDYVELSGGHTVLGRIKDTYVVQANGEVLNYKGSRTSSRIARKKVMPGAKIYVPINVDRMNTTEKAQSWVDTLVRSAILAGIVL
jgi:protein involved in polysaccharide export with SLBB domain